MTTLQKTLVTATILATSVVTPLVIQHQAKVALRKENESLHQQMEQLTGLQAETERLSSLLVQANNRELPPDKELLRLRGEVGLLRRQTNELGRLLEDNQRSHSIPKPRGLPAKTNQSELSQKLWARAEDVLLSIARKWPEKSKAEFLTQLPKFLDSEFRNSNFFGIGGYSEGENRVTLFVHIDQLKELRGFNLERHDDAWQISSSSPVLDDPSAHEPSAAP